MSANPTPDFEQLQLIPPLLQALREEGYRRPTPIQAQAIPHVLSGRDLLGCAQTGTGKTAAFALPILQRLSAERAAAPAAAGAAPAATGHGHGHSHKAAGHRPIKALILSPTRELAAQIGDSFTAYGRHTGIRHTVIFGGVSQQPQETALHRGVDIVVATPGRLCDLMEQGRVDLRQLEIFVLDEADRMLDMGFLPDVRRIEAACPEHRQTLFFSATLGPQIIRVSHSFVRDPIRVEVAPNATPVDAIEQRLYRVERGDKLDLLLALLRDPAIERAIVFTRTKHGADKVDRRLHQAGIRTLAIHGNKTQGARQRALDGFKSGSIRVLVATDIAARGIDVDNVTHVINFDMPVEPEAYVHRIGRTGRAEAVGVALSFCTPEERDELRAIEKLCRIEIPLIRAETVLRGGATGASHSSNPTLRGGAAQTAHNEPIERDPSDDIEPRHERGDRGDRHGRSGGRDRGRGPARHGRERGDHRDSRGPRHGGGAGDSHGGPERRPTHRDASRVNDHAPLHGSEAAPLPQSLREPARDSAREPARDGRREIRHEPRHQPRADRPHDLHDEPFHSPRHVERPAEGSREHRDSRDNRAPRDQGDGREQRESREARDARHARDTRAPRASHGDRPRDDDRHAGRSNDERNHRAPRDSRDSRDSREGGDRSEGSDRGPRSNNRQPRRWR